MSDLQSRDEYGRQLIDFSRPLVTSHTPPKRVMVLPDQPLVTRRKRVAISRDDTNIAADPKDWKNVTVWHYDAYGCCASTDRSPSPMDLRHATGGAA